MHLPRILLVALSAGAVDADAARWDARLVSHAAASQSNAGNGVSVTTKLGLDASSEGFFPLASAPLTPDGRWALIQSAATNLVEAVTEGNSGYDVFVFDRDTGAVTLVSRASGAGLATPDRPSHAVAISADGRWVLYESNASNIVAGLPVAVAPHIFVHDRVTSTTTLVAEGLSSSIGGNQTRSLALSVDGRWTLYQHYDSASSNNGVGDEVRLFDRDTGTTTLVSHVAGSPGIPAYPSVGKSLSADGRWVLFSSSTTNVVAGAFDMNSGTDVFLYDRETNASMLVSRAAGSPTTAAGAASQPNAFDPQANWVLFTSIATNVVPGIDANNSEDVFLFERATGTSTLVSRAPGPGTVAASGRSTGRAVSADGRWVLFDSTAGDVAGAPNAGGGLFLFDRWSGNSTLVVAAQPTLSSLSADGRRVLFGDSQAFLFDREGGTTTLVSHTTASASAPGNGASPPSAISADGGTILFDSNATDLVSGVVDANSAADVFLSRQMFLVTPNAGSNGVLAPAIAVDVPYAGTTSFTVTPAQGYGIGTVSGCDGTLVGQTYTTGAIRTDCTVSATFIAASDEIFANGFESP